MKTVPKFIIFLISIFAALSVDAYSGVVLSMVKDGSKLEAVDPVFVCDDFALYEKADISAYNVEARDIMPDLPGD